MENSKDLDALNELVNDYSEKEKALAVFSSELELKSKEFATFIEQQRRQQDELQVLKEAIKEYMTNHNIMQHDTGLVELKLSSTGKFNCEDIEKVPEECVKVVKQLDNARVKWYEKLNGKLPEGVTPQGYRLTMKVHD